MSLIENGRPLTGSVAGSFRARSSNRVHLELAGERVDGALDGKGADGLARGAHEGVGDAAQLGHLLADAIRRHRVEMSRRKTDLLGEVIVG
jgi:hypothetical protein